MIVTTRKGYDAWRHKLLFRLFGLYFSNPVSRNEERQQMELRRSMAECDREYFIRYNELKVMLWQLEQATCYVPEAKEAAIAAIKQELLLLEAQKELRYFGYEKS